MDKQQRISELFPRYLNGNIGEMEKSELLRLIEETDSTFLSSLLENTWNETEAEIRVFSEEESSEMLRHILSGEKRTRVIPFFKRKWVQVAAAACLMAAVVGILFFRTAENIASKKPLSAGVIVPGGNKAILTLGDGSIIVLDSAANGTLTEQGNVAVKKLEDGKLTYDAGDTFPAEVLYNIVSTPRGGQYQLTLADGSKVWLNAASSLRFPTAFPGKERRVEIIGEAYFEVARNESKPFMVDVAGKGMVEVLGTQFNINAYEDEPAIKTTLLEGKVKVSAANTSQTSVLIPGQQAQLTNELRILDNVDTEEIMAWKTGWFYFDHSELPAIMRQVSRWYNVDVHYEGRISKKSFSGIVGRDNDIKDVLKIMENAGIRFRIEGSSITVLQQ